MNKIAKNIFALVFFLFGIFGTIGLVQDLKSGTEVDWFFVMVIFGVGYGIPLFIVMPIRSSSEKDPLDQYADADVEGYGGGSDGGSDES